MQIHHRLIRALGPSTAAQMKKASAAMARSSSNCVDGVLAVQSER
jgi:hypothetical protein